MLYQMLYLTEKYLSYSGDQGSSVTMKKRWKYGK